MKQRLRYQGDLFHRIVWMLAIPDAGCGNNGTPAVVNDASSDVGPTVDDRPLGTGSHLRREIASLPTANGSNAPISVRWMHASTG